MKAAGIAGGWLLLAGVLAAQSPAGPQPASVGPQLNAQDRVNLFVARHEFQPALDLIAAEIAAKRATPELYNSRGIVHQQLNQFKAAESDYKQALHKVAHSSVFLNNLGTVYFEEKKYNQAIKQYQQALRYDNSRAAYYVNLGAADYAQKRYEPAMAAFRQALTIDPQALFPQGEAGPVVQAAGASDPARYHYDMSRLLASLGQLDEALHQFRQAQDLNYPGLKDSLTDPAFAALRALPEYRQCMGLSPVAAPGPGPIPH